ncbi:MAG: MerR family transcriptional regulator [Propionibacteriaceae bacterium]|nr:MerR family transcriptional regulator [Propionibacteriaceae bacterium]
MPPDQRRSIGAILPILKAEFPDITISKIRFLESEGLISPERAPSGYRRYSQADIDRLRYILRMQRDHYLPLKVIRDHLDMMDRGVEPPVPDTPAVPGLAEAEEDASSDHQPIKLTKRELIQVSGLSEATLVELERQQMVLPRRGSMYYGREALMICVVARKMQGYGMDIRHLRAIKQSAERESGMVEQAMAPLRHRQQAGEHLQELTQLVIQAHAALMYTLLQR